jgi:hypothetical protein
VRIRKLGYQYRMGLHTFNTRYDSLYQTPDRTMKDLKYGRRMMLSCFVVLWFCGVLFGLVLFFFFRLAVMQFVSTCCDLTLTNAQSAPDVADG